MDIREEMRSDRAAIHRLHVRAFGRPDEAGLVDRLRADGDTVISLVGHVDGELAGHVLFSRMDAPVPALGLAPVSVDLHHRRQGLAARLIHTGIGCARRQGWAGIFVLGEPDYYARFGFSRAAAEAFSCAYTGEYFMALALSARFPRRGHVAYAPAFSALD